MNYPGDGDPGTAGLPTGVSWRGGRRSAAPAVRRGWQQGTLPQPLVQLHNQERRRRMRVAVLLLALLSLFGLWLKNDIMMLVAKQKPQVKKGYHKETY